MTREAMEDSGAVHTRLKASNDEIDTQVTALWRTNCRRRPRRRRC